MNQLDSSLNELFLALSSRLDSSIDLNQTAQWQKASRSFYDLCVTPVILNYVEDLIGSNFVLWGGQFFLKQPSWVCCSLASRCTILASIPSKCCHGLASSI